MSAMSSGTRTWEAGANLLRDVSHPVRLCALHVLRGGPRSVSEINEVVGVGQPNLSQHLAVLREAGMVASQPDGPRRLYYLLNPALVQAILGALEQDREEVAQSA